VDFVVVRNLPVASSFVVGLAVIIGKPDAILNAGNV
jgi:hypothetical protein